MLVITGIVASLIAAGSKFYVAKNCNGIACNLENAAIAITPDQFFLVDFEIASSRLRVFRIIKLGLLCYPKFDDTIGEVSNKIY